MAATSAEADMSKHLPAPSTFAPSRNDVLSSLAFFFGDPASPEKLRDYSEHQAATYHFPGEYLCLVTALVSPIVFLCQCVRQKLYKPDV